MTPQIKDIMEYGIMAVIAGVFIKQQQALFNKVFEILEKVTATISKLENKINNSDKLTGKTLDGGCKRGLLNTFLRTISKKIGVSYQGKLS